jgi:hypothetical protein
LRGDETEEIYFILFIHSGGIEKKMDEAHEMHQVASASSGGNGVESRNQCEQ